MKDLEGLTVKQLRVLAKKAGLRGYSKLKKSELIRRLQQIEPSNEEEDKTDKIPDFSKEQEEHQLHQELPSHDTRSTHVRIPEDPLKDLGDLPYSYGIDMIDFLPVNPEVGHVMWDVSTTTWERISRAEALILRIEEESGKVVFQETIDKGVREYFVHFSGLTRGPYRGVILIQTGGIVERLMGSAPRKLPPNLPGRGPVVFAKVPWDTPLNMLKELQKVSNPPSGGGFLISEPDNTPYTRRWK